MRWCVVCRGIELNWIWCAPCPTASYSAQEEWNEMKWWVSAVVGVLWHSVAYGISQIWLLMVVRSVVCCEAMMLWWWEVLCVINQSCYVALRSNDVAKQWYYVLYSCVNIGICIVYICIAWKGVPTCYIHIYMLDYSPMSRQSRHICWHI